jgi:hypothetical protein
MLHGDLASGRWWTMPLLDQMANAGADVGRALNAKLAGDDTRLQHALDRALELIDLTLADPRRSPSEIKEIARMREVVCDYLVGSNEYGSTSDWIDDYFTQFALAARRDR